MNWKSSGLAACQKETGKTTDNLFWWTSSTTEMVPSRRSCLPFPCLMLWTMAVDAIVHEISTHEIIEPGHE